ncbi:uncharacterized protein LOC124654619 [Lolium rigidum]|uniref:uncharacterized protein LOC124654619 n=1 Tax=Lolium rigidum TaxID=89674 RepID=UPI001F5DCD9F|nr:uncharacterized protein LOC124654619 [Lolium rigidum]XP_047049571.1 uncharacterized protein LOC124654619 [Lolium rigidum]
MDGAIAHFATMGYPKADIRSTVEQLIEVYGEGGMLHIKADKYSVVLDALFEKQEQEEQPQLLLEQEDPNTQNEAAMCKAPVEGVMSIVEAHNEISAIEGADPMLIDDLLAPEATLPHPAATGNSRARRPCYGWISESESDSDYEEYLASQQHEVDAPIPVEYACSVQGSN